MARPAAEIEPDSPTSSSSLILPGPMDPLGQVDPKGQPRHGR